MKYYWELKYGDWKDLKSALIPPDKVEVTKRRWDNGDPIHLSTGSVPANQIRSFEQTAKPVASQALIESASQAFNEPVVNESGISSRWVKKTVTQDRWQRYFSAIPSYKFLREEGGMAIIAFRLPVHEVNQLNTPYCSDGEVNQLTQS